MKFQQKRDALRIKSSYPVKNQYMVRWERDGGVPWDRGLCLPNSVINVILKVPDENRYYRVWSKAQAQFFDWSDNNGIFNIYGFIVLRPNDGRRDTSVFD